jgi:predicted nucleic acid-binding protein
MNYVVDASVAIKWYLPEENTDDAERLLAVDNFLHAPELILPEFGSIVWKRIRRGEMAAQKGQEIIEEFVGAPLLKYPHAPLLEAAFAGAIETAQTVYDWIYLALAVSLNCQMVTADARFYHALQASRHARHLVWVADIP